MLTFLGFVKAASQKTVTFTSEEVQQLKREAGTAVLEQGTFHEDGSLTVLVSEILAAANALSTPGPSDLVELSKAGYFTILLDENLSALEPALEDDGFKVIVAQPGLKDDALKRLARGCAILTKNSKDFIDDACRFDYDVISIELFKFIDTKADRTNQSVRKISGAVRRSQLGKRRGCFCLRIRDDGSFHLEELV